MAELSGNQTCPSRREMSGRAQDKNRIRKLDLAAVRLGLETQFST